MVHAIRILKCKKGHSLPIEYDGNECGCHHDGKPCIIISCTKCFEEELKNKEKDYNFENVTIPLDEDAMKELNNFLGTKEI